MDTIIEETPVEEKAVKKTRKPRTPKVEKQEPKKLTEQEYLWTLAREAEKQRLDAPPTDTTPGHIAIDAKRKLKRVMEQYGGQDRENGRHGLFVDHRKLEEKAHAGYRPEYENGSLVRNGTDVLITCSTKLLREQQRQSKAISDRQTIAATKKSSTPEADNDVNVGHKSQVRVLEADNR